MDLDDFINRSPNSGLNNESPKNDEPYVRIVGDKIDKDRGGIELSLDWNDEFVEYLRSQGYHGSEDELVIQKWLHSLYTDMESRLKERNPGDFQ